MTVEINGMTVEVLGKPYQLKCAPSEVDSIQKAAEYLDEKMRDLRKNCNILSLDRLAIVAALNIAHELLTFEKNASVQTYAMTQRLRDLQNKIDQALSKSQLEFSTTG